MDGALALILALPIGGVVFLALYITVKVATYEQADDPLRLQNKQNYLAALNNVVNGQTPDVVVILFDDLGYGDVGFTGNSSIRTPHMDELARNGVLMTNFCSAPVCSPSRAATMTGRMAPRNGLTVVPFPSGTPLDRANRFFDNPVRLPREEIIIADVLQASGSCRYGRQVHNRIMINPFRPSLASTRFSARSFHDMNPFHLVEGEIGRGEKIAHAAPVDQTKLNGLYAEKAEQFIAAAPTDKPMFCISRIIFRMFRFTPRRTSMGAPMPVFTVMYAGLDDTVGRIVDALKSVAHLKTHSSSSPAIMVHGGRAEC